MGYEANFDPPLDHRYKCPVCLCALKDAKQTKCGHRLCSLCLTSVRGDNWYFRCPIDNTWSNQVFDDTAFQRDVLSLNVKCNNELCAWNGELRELDNHMGVCQYEKIECPNKCKKEVMKIELPKHELECPQRVETCKHCNISIIAAQMAHHHISFCPKYPFTCEKCGEVEICREKWNAHINIINGNCSKSIIPCSFKHIGCFYEDARSYMAKHYVDANTHHLMLLSTRIIDLEMKNRLDIQVCTGKFQQTISTLEGKIHESEKKNESMGKDLNEAKSSICELKTSIKELKSKINAGIRTSSSSTQTQKQDIYEWKLDLSSKRESYFSPTYRLPNSGYKFHLCLKPEDSEGSSTVRVVLEMSDNDVDGFPFSFDFCFYLNGPLKTASEDRLEDVERLNHCILSSTKATITERVKQLKSTVTTNPFIRSGIPSKTLLLSKSVDFYSFVFDKSVNIEFTVELVKKIVK